MRVSSMQQITVKHAFKAMMYVAREEGFDEQLNEKWLQLADWLEEYENEQNMDVAAMVDNIETFYLAIDKRDYEEEELEKREED